MVHPEQAYSFPDWRSWVSLLSFLSFHKPPLALWLGLCLQDRRSGNIRALQVWWHFSLEQELGK